MMIGEQDDLSGDFPRIVHVTSSSLQRRPAVADLWVGVAGDYVPAGALLAPRALAALIL